MLHGRALLPRRPPERSLALSLALYRYFTFMVGVALTLAWPTVRGEQVEPKVYGALALVAGFILLGILIGPGIYLRPKSLLSYGYLAVDTASSVAAALLTGGLNSGFLLYSLASVLAASFFMTRMISLAVAGLLSATLLAAHLASGAFTWVLSGNMLSVFLLYTIAACLVALIPYLANLNLRQQLEDRVAMEERLRMRREVHDTLAQDIAFLSMRVAHIRESLGEAEAVPATRAVTDVTSLQEALKKTYQDVRDYLDMLTALATLDLFEGLQELGRDVMQRTGVELEIGLPKGSLRLSPQMEANVLAVAREALMNVEKHASASRVRLALSVEDGDVLRLVVEDNGQGFDPALRTPAGHYGLSGMRERAEGLGGALEVRSAPGQGATVELRIPL